jgi:hypothetical protein
MTWFADKLGPKPTAANAEPPPARSAGPAAATQKPQPAPKQADAPEKKKKGWF